MEKPILNQLRLIIRYINTHLNFIIGWLDLRNSEKEPPRVDWAKALPQRIKLFKAMRVFKVHML